MGSFLDRLLGAAPGIAAKGIAGARAGEDRRRKLQFEDEDRAARVQREALQRMLLESQVDENLARGEYYRTPKPLPTTAQRPVRDPVKDALDIETGKIELEKKYEVGRFKPQAPQAQGKGGAEAQPGKVLPASNVSKLSGMTSVLRAAEQARDAMRDANAQGLQVSGPITGRITGITEALGLGGLGGSKEALSVRGKLANVTSEIMKQRSGGAITPQEFVRLEPFLASKNDTEGNALQKLNDLIAYLNSTRDTELDTYRSAGYRVPGEEVPGEGEGDADLDDARAELEASRKRRAARVPVVAPVTVDPDLERLRKRKKGLPPGGSYPLNKPIP